MGRVRAARTARSRRSGAARRAAGRGRGRTATKRKPVASELDGVGRLSVDMPAAIPLALARVDDGGERLARSAGGRTAPAMPIEAVRSKWPIQSTSIPAVGGDRVEVVERADGLDHRDHHQLRRWPRACSRATSPRARRRRASRSRARPPAGTWRRPTTARASPASRISGTITPSAPSASTLPIRCASSVRHAHERDDLGRRERRRAAGGSGLSRPAGVLLVEDDELGAGAGRGARQPGRVEVDREHPEHGLARPEARERRVRPHVRPPARAHRPDVSTSPSRTREQARRRGSRTCTRATGTKVRRSPTASGPSNAADEAVLLGHALDDRVALDALGHAAQRRARRRRRRRCRPRTSCCRSRSSPCRAPVTLTTVASTVSARSSLAAPRRARPASGR